MRYIEKKIEVSKGIAFFILIISLILANLSPVFSFLFLLSIIPTVFIGIRMKPHISIILVFGIAIIYYFLFGLEKTVHTFLIYVIPSLLSAIIYGSGIFITSSFEIKHLIVKKDDQFLVYASIKLFLISIMTFMLGAIMYFIFEKYFLNINVLSQMKEMIKSTSLNYSQVASAYKISNKEMQAVIDTIVENSGVIVLTIYFIKSMITAMISYFIAIPITNKFSKERLLYNGFDMISLPGKPAIIYLVCIGLSFLAESIDLKFITPDMINAFISVLSVLFFIEGLSLIVYLIRRWKSLKNTANWIVILVLFIFMGIFLGVVALGVMDNVFNYRIRWNNRLIIGGRDER